MRLTERDGKSRITLVFTQDTPEMDRLIAVVRKLYPPRQVSTGPGEEAPALQFDDNEGALERFENDVFDTLLRRFKDAEIKEEGTKAIKNLPEVKRNKPLVA